MVRCNQAQSIGLSTLDKAPRAEEREPSLAVVQPMR